MAKASRRRPSAKRQPAASRRQPRPSVPTRPQGPAKTYTSKPVPVDFAGPGHRLNRADLEISGIFHGEGSYEGRIFLNNPGADHNTPCTLDHGYAGSFHIFGHGGCFGDAGHCEVQGHRDAYDFRAPHALTPAKKRVTITDAVLKVARSNQQMTVTIVPVVSAANELCDVHNVFRFEQMRLVTYDP
jgi:hypothetical protein